MRGGVHEAPTAFVAPPIIEVVLAVEFPSRPHLGAVRLARLHERWQAAYPQTEEQPALPPSFSVGSDGAMSIEFTAGLPSLRLWMLSATGERLVQVQHDRLILNWRRIGEGAPYPGFSSLLPELSRLWQDLGAYEAEQGRPPLSPRVVEVTYINLVSLDEDEEPGAVFAVLAHESSDSARPLTVTSVVTEDRVEHPWGLGQLSTSLHRVAGPVESSYNLNVTTRLSITAQPSADTVHDLLDAAHRRSVDLFLASTTSAAHTKWGGSR